MRTLDLIFRIKKRFLILFLVLSFDAANAETVICENVYSVPEFMQASRDLNSFVEARLAVFSFEGNSLREVTMTVDWFFNGEIKQSSKFTNICDVKSISGANAVECWEDVKQKNNGVVSSVGDLDYEIVKISWPGKTVSLPTSDLLTSDRILDLELVSLTFKKTLEGQKADVEISNFGRLRCR